jgi:hypothetical protein
MTRPTSHPFPRQPVPMFGEGAADLRLCEEPGCSIERPLVEMSRLPDGSWRCVPHGAADERDGR